jgi:Spy/CpxP family protein refolding chaperone
MMKRFRFNNLMFAGLILLFAFSIASAQFQALPPDGENPPPRRPNLLRELNLSDDQIQQIRRLNRQRRPVMIESQRRLREANMALDKAIYADTEDESEIQLRMKELQSAQAEVIKNRTITEREVRKILTFEQLARFRTLRSEYMQVNNPANRPNNRRQNLRNIPRGLRQKPAGNPPRRRPVQ